MDQTEMQLLAQFGSILNVNQHRMFMINVLEGAAEDKFRSELLGKFQILNARIKTNNAGGVGTPRCGHCPHQTRMKIMKRSTIYALLFASLLTIGLQSVHAGNTELSTEEVTELISGKTVYGTSSLLDQHLSALKTFGLGVDWNLEHSFYISQK